MHLALGRCETFWIVPNSQWFWLPRFAKQNHRPISPPVSMALLPRPAGLWAVTWPQASAGQCASSPLFWNGSHHFLVLERVEEPPQCFWVGLAVLPLGGRPGPHAGNTGAVFKTAPQLGRHRTRASESFLVTFSWFFSWLTLVLCYKPSTVFQISGNVFFSESSCLFLMFLWRVRSMELPDPTFYWHH